MLKDENGNNADARRPSRFDPYSLARGASRPKGRPIDQKGIQDSRYLPDTEFDGIWDSIILPHGVKDRLLAQAVLNFTARAKLQTAYLPLHGIILLVGPPGRARPLSRAGWHRALRRPSTPP